MSNWTDGNNAPVCADESPFNTWSDWNAGQRDLFILDQTGTLIFHDNITSGIPDNLEELILDMLSPTTASCILGEVYVSEGHTSGSPEDYIELYNSGNIDCSLEGFQLDDNEELDDLIFGNIILPAGEFWIGYRDGDGSFTSGLGSDGDVIVLADTAGNILTVNLEPSIEYQGIELSQSFNASGIGCYTNPSPGEENSECITLSNYKDNSVLNEYKLYQNYPNPFNPTTLIKYDLPSELNVNITVYDVRGTRVRNLVEQKQNPGSKSIQWNSKNNQGQFVPAGIYIYSIETENFRQTKKMLLLK